MSTSSISSSNGGEPSGGGWTGKVVARILPPDIEGDYEVLYKPSKRRIDPAPLLQSSRNKKNRKERTPLPDVSALGLSSQSALTSEESRWMSLDVVLYPKDEGEHRNSMETTTKAEPMQIHMNRATQELVNSVLARMEVSVLRKIEHSLPLQDRKCKGKSGLKNKQYMKQMNPDHTPSSLTLLWVDENAPINGNRKELDFANQTNGEFWKELALNYPPDQLHFNLTLNANTVIPMKVDSCPPTIIGMHVFENLEGRVYIGVPLVVGVDLLYADHAVVNWFADGELVESDSASFTPQQEHLGKNIAILLTPTRPGHDGRGYEEAYPFLHRVECRPENANLQIRPEWILPRGEEGHRKLRVVSYNILADLNAFHDVRGMRPFYPYCDTEYLRRTRRMPVILHELLAYQADIICLQEVDVIIFDQLFSPSLEAHGYQGFYRKKLGSSEGIAMFWSLSTFERSSPEDMLSFPIQRLFPASKGMVCLEDWKSMYDLEEFLQQSDELRSIVQEKTGHVAQFATLRFKDSSLSDENNQKPPSLTVANTHLFYHPLGAHIRMMQLFCVCHQLEKLRKGSPVVFCGDLNSTPDSGAAQLLLKRRVSADHKTWRHLHTYTWDPDRRASPAATPLLEPFSMGLPDSFPRFQSGYEEFPPFTHYIREFSGALDYICASEASEGEVFGFYPDSSGPTLSEEEVKKNVAMPSEILPSDHISLVCEFDFQRYQNN